MRNFKQDMQQVFVNSPIHDVMLSQLQEFNRKFHQQVSPYSLPRPELLQPMVVQLHAAIAAELKAGGEVSLQTLDSGSCLSPELSLAFRHTFNPDSKYCDLGQLSAAQFKAMQRNPFMDSLLLMEVANAIMLTGALRELYGAAPVATAKAALGMETIASGSFSQRARPAPRAARLRP